MRHGKNVKYLNRGIVPYGVFICIVNPVLAYNELLRMAYLLLRY